MISAAPPTTPPSAGGGGIKIPIYRDFCVPAPVGLTEGLTAPRVWGPLYCTSYKVAHKNSTSDTAEERLREPELAPQERRLLFARKSPRQFGIGGGGGGTTSTSGATADPAKRVSAGLNALLGDAEFDWVSLAG